MKRSARLTSLAAIARIGELVEVGSILRSSGLAALIAAAIVVPPARSLSQTYVLTDLGALAGSPSAAFHVSPAGIVSGCYRNAGVDTPCLWKPTASGMVFQSLGVTLNPTWMRAFGVNDSAKAAVTGAHPFDWECGFLWDGTWHNLTNKSTETEAIAINAAGNIAGVIYTSRSGSCATLWKNLRSYTIPSATEAMDINSSGQVVGYGGSTQTPYVWTPSTVNGITGNTAFLPFPGIAYGISDSGDVVGGAGTAGTQAFFWSHSTGSVTYLGNLTGYQNNAARSVNSAGQVVGYAYNTAQDTRGFLWDSVNGMRDLNSLTIQGGIPAGWVFTCAAGGGLMTHFAAVSINDVGQICGTASVTLDGVTSSHAFLLTPQ